jgi:hypothetical protein
MALDFSGGTADEKGEVEVSLGFYLETPKNIFADVQAFYARYGQAQTAT